MMSVKSLAIFVVCLVSATIVIQAAGLADLVDNPQTGIEGDVDETSEDVTEQVVERDRLGDGIVGNVYAALETLSAVLVMILRLPQALINLGLLREYSVFVTAPLSIILGIAFLQFLAGRVLE